MYGINEFHLLQRYTQNLKQAERHAERQRWIKEADAEAQAERPRRRSARQRWSSFASLFLF